MNCWWLILIVAVAALGLGIALGIILRKRRASDKHRGIALQNNAQDQLAELGKIAGGLMHEVKNPLSTINVNLQLLAEDLERYRDEDHARLLRRLTHVQSEADRVKSILDDLQQYARKPELHLAPKDIRLIVDELSDFFAPQAEAAGVVMRTDLADRPVTCTVDAALLKQSVLNLMINAVQAMTDGGELILRVGTSDSQATIEVIDTGPGIGDEAISRIFDVYYSTKKGGSGLGLPTARRLAREHGGDLTVYSEPGRGTRFVITLPPVGDA